MGKCWHPTHRTDLVDSRVPDDRVSSVRPRVGEQDSRVRDA